jgi:hypothetical protein
VVRSVAHDWKQTVFILSPIISSTVQTIYEHSTCRRPWAAIQEMMRRGVMPTSNTEKALAEAFSTSPDFANSVVEQSRRYRALHAASAKSALTVCLTHFFWLFRPFPLDRPSTADPPLWCGVLTTALPHCCGKCSI